MQCVGVAELVKNQAVCGFVMAGKKFLRPPRCINGGGHLKRLNAIGTGLCTMRGIRTGHDRRQTMRESVDDTVHQSQQRHHEQSQGEVAAHDLPNDDAEIHADLNSVNGVNAERDR